MITESEFNQRISVIWEWMEEIHAIPFPQEIRQYVETKCRRDLDESKINLTNLKNEIDKSCCAIAIWADDNSRSYKNRHTESERENSGKTTKRIYPKCFEKRLDKISFIAERTLTIDEFKARTLIPMGYVNWDWKQWCAAWNKANPRLKRKMTADVLKAEYYKARKEKDIAEGYFAFTASYLCNMLGPLIDQIKKFQKFKQEVKDDFQVDIENHVATPMRGHHFKGNELDEFIRDIDDLYNSKMKTLREQCY